MTSKIMGLDTTRQSGSLSSAETVLGKFATYPVKSFEALATAGTLRMDLINAKASPT